jgi:hypothetical protein
MEPLPSPIAQGSAPHAGCDPRSVQQARRCDHCGHRGADVTANWWHLGGKGNVLIVECENATVCGARKDQAHQSPSLILSSVCGARPAFVEVPPARAGKDGE